MSLSFRIMWLRYRLKGILLRVGHILHIIAVWMLAYCAGTVAVLFYMVMSNGKASIFEPDKTVATIEFGMASFMTLCGIVISLTSLRHIK